MLGRSSPSVVELYRGTIIPGRDWLAGCDFSESFLSKSFLGSFLLGSFLLGSCLSGFARSSASGEDLPTTGEVILPPLAGASWRTAPAGRLGPGHQPPRSSARSGRHPPGFRCIHDRPRTADRCMSLVR